MAKPTDFTAVGNIVPLSIECLAHRSNQPDAAVDITVENVLDDRTADDHTVCLLCGACGSLGRTDAEADGKRDIRITACGRADLML